MPLDIEQIYANFCSDWDVQDGIFQSVSPLAMRFDCSALEKVYFWQIRALKAQLNKGDKPWRDEAANLIGLPWCETQSLRQSSCDHVRRSRSAMQKSSNCKKQSGAQYGTMVSEGRRRIFNAEWLRKDWCDCIFVLSAADHCLVFSSSNCLFCDVLCETFRCRCYLDVLSGVVLVVGNIIATSSGSRWQ